MTVPGERQHEWEKNTWPVLKDLAANHMDAGIHFQQTKLFIRKKDLGTEKAEKCVQTRANSTGLTDSQIFEGPRASLLAGVESHPRG
jgi:hypothetical protein